MRTIMTLVGVLVAGWAIGSIVALRHFDAKFYDCHEGFKVAATYEEREIYFRCMEIANRDTSLWPPVWVERWNADYVAETRAEKD